MYYIIKNVSKIKLTYTEYGDLEKSVTVELNEGDIIDYPWTMWAPNIVWFEPATQLDKLMILSGRMPCERIKGVIESVSISTKFPAEYVTCTYTLD